MAKPEKPKGEYTIIHCPYCRAGYSKIHYFAHANARGLWIKCSRCTAEFEVIINDGHQVRVTRG